MHSRKMIPALATAALTGACAAAQPAVPVLGAATEIRALAGTWEGEYSSSMTGRSGSISFTLTAHGDSAFGDVVMVPAGLGRPLRPWDDRQMSPTRPQPEALSINFVRVERNEVTGTLAPYADPVTGEKLSTSFRGRVQGDTIEGSFTTRPAASANPQTGAWTVKRRRG